MNSIYFKNFLINALMVLLSFLILGMAFVFLGRSFIINEKKDALTTNAEAIVRSASAYSKEDDLDDLDLRMLIASVSMVTGNQVFITDTEGTVVSCSDMELACPHIGRTVDAQTIAAIGTDGYDQLTTLGNFYKSMHYVVAKPVLSADKSLIYGYVFVTSDSETIAQTWNTFQLVFLCVAIVVLAVATLLSFITSKRQAKPLKEMAAAAHQFAHGDFSVRVEEDPNRRDELGELTRAFNTMADSMEKSERRRTEFIANVSHELKTPMTTIAGFADGILDGTIPPENEKKYLETISQETKRLSRLVRRMLELSRIQSSDAEELKKKTFDAGEVILQTLLNFEGKINAKKLEVNAQIPEESMIVRGDPDAITQVIYNLLDNAVKFAPESTELGVSLWKQDGKAFVSVKNHGETIAPDELNRIFDRFHKTDQSRSKDRDGVGLGLYIVKTIVNNHDEDIFVTSKDGVTEFVFTLTLA